MELGIASSGRSDRRWNCPRNHTSACMNGVGSPDRKASRTKTGRAVAIVVPDALADLCDRGMYGNQHQMVGHNVLGWVFPIEGLQ